MGGMWGELKLVNTCGARRTDARVVGLSGSSIWVIVVVEICGPVIGPRSES